jgi:hypothetical protein
MTLTNSNGTDTIQSRQNDAPLKVKLVIHNQFPDIELASPLCCGDGATCCLSSDHRVNAGSTMEAVFNFDTDQHVSIGALMYKLQKSITDQSDEEVISSEDETTCIQLVVILDVCDSGETLYSFLIEHDKDHIWNRVELMKLAKYYEMFDMHYDSDEETWLMHDNTVLMESLNIIYEEECYKLELTISKGNINKNTRRPLYFDVDR